MSKTTDWVIDDLNNRSYDHKEENMTKLTACGKCKFLIKKPGVWGLDFNDGLMCRAMPMQGKFNCFTGEYAPNEFGRCCDINKGACALYKEEEE